MHFYLIGEKANTKWYNVYVHVETMSKLLNYELSSIHKTCSFVNILRYLSIDNISNTLVNAIHLLLILRFTMLPQFQCEADGKLWGLAIWPIYIGGKNLITMDIRNNYIMAANHVIHPCVCRDEPMLCIMQMLSTWDNSKHFNHNGLAGRIWHVDP